MRLPDPNLEPAIRDPKKLRNTAFVLVGIMIFGGFFILKAYDRWALSKAGDDRPAVVYRIQKERDLRMLRQDGQSADLADLRGNVVAVHVISLRNPETAELSLGVMKRLAQSRAATADFRLISLVVDPLAENELIPTLQKAAASHGMELPQWWLGSNEPGTLHKFIKNELKADTYPHEKDGKWEFDSSIVLIDRDGHIRRAVVPQKRGGPPFIATFDFQQAAAWDAKDVLTGTERNNQQELEFLLNQTVDKLLAESLESP
jgi:cytochrome oxidase Cu insertion factor (SCO1/SenC/PrrC family)